VYTIVYTILKLMLTFVYKKYIIINTLYSEVCTHYKCALFGCAIYLPGNP
jgi:hypothetical protein